MIAVAVTVAAMIATMLSPDRPNLIQVTLPMALPGTFSLARVDPAGSSFCFAWQRFLFGHLRTYRKVVPSHCR
ncbi:MAG: hypothetical protein WBE24_04560, partial [Candidatus Acidiferrum sp.]